MTASENTLLFRDMLKSIEPGMAEILRTNQRYGKDVRALIKNSRAILKRQWMLSQTT